MFTCLMHLSYHLKKLHKIFDKILCRRKAIALNISSAIAFKIYGIQLKSLYIYAINKYATVHIFL